MNIFLTHEDPRECAVVLDDRRLVKMVLETAQLLATNCLTVGVDLGYRATHQNHPCAVWSRSSSLAFGWLAEHGLWLSDEYYRRYRRVHASREVIEASVPHRKTFDNKPLTFDFNCSGYDTGDVHHDYRLCLVNKWKNKDVRPRWRGNAPSWYRTLYDEV